VPEDIKPMVDKTIIEKFKYLLEKILNISPNVTQKHNLAC